jgi:hypothetical protein
MNNTKLILILQPESRFDQGIPEIAVAAINGYAPCFDVALPPASTSSAQHRFGRISKNEIFKKACGRL